MSSTARPAPSAAPPRPTRAGGSELAELARRHGLSVSGARRPFLASMSGQLWARRHFVTAYATARLTAQYSQARLGQVWQIMTPLLNAVVYYFVFGVLLGTSRGVPDFIPFLVTGVFIWTFTSQAVIAGTRAISGNLGIIRALHFPRAALPIALTIQQLQQALFSMAALVVILLVLRAEPRACRGSWRSRCLLCQAVFNTGLALIVARLGSRTPDVAQLMPFIVRVWMYISGVMWSVQRLAGHGRVPHFVYVAAAGQPGRGLHRPDALRVHRQLHPTASCPPHVWALAAGLGRRDRDRRFRVLLAVARRSTAVAERIPTVVVDDVHVTYRVHGTARHARAAPRPRAARPAGRPGRRLPGVREVHAVQGRQLRGLRGRGHRPDRLERLRQVHHPLRDRLRCCPTAHRSDLHRRPALAARSVRSV